jgi:SAM-dependent methyltransferase
MTSVNYSESLLRNEYDTREPIRTALHLLMKTYDVYDRDVAELGSGLGHNLEIFAERNRVTGIEGLSAAAVEACHRGIPTIHADLATVIPLESARFDVVLCLDVLEHLLEPDHCLGEAHRILRQNGLLVVNVPNHFSLSGRINIVRGSGIDSARFFPNHSDWENPHVRFFRHASIVELIGRSGFRVDADWSGQFPSIPIISKLHATRRSRIAQALAARVPELFAGGFLVISRRI